VNVLIGTEAVQFLFWEYTNRNSLPLIYALHDVWQVAVMMRLGQEDDPWLQMGLSRTARREEVNRTYRYAATSVADPDPYLLRMPDLARIRMFKLHFIFENNYIDIFIKIIF
jgi:hypothetical protein